MGCVQAQERRRRAKTGQSLLPNGRLAPESHACDEKVQAGERRATSGSSAPPLDLNGIEVPVDDDKVPATLRSSRVYSRASVVSTQLRVMVSHHCDYIDPSTGVMISMGLEDRALHGDSKHKLSRHPHLDRKSRDVDSPRGEKLAKSIVMNARDMAQATGQESDDTTHDDWVGPNNENALAVLMEEKDLRKIARTLVILNTKVLAMMQREPIMTRPTAPAKIFGDLHGQFRDFLLFLHYYGFPSFEGPCFIFNGDWVDRGQHQIETIVLIFALKLAFPERVFLIRGNHEDSQVNAHMSEAGFSHALRAKFGRQTGEKVFAKFAKTFEWLPVAALLDDRILIVHGGIGSGDWTLQQLQKVKRPITHGDMQGDTLVYNILWSDPVDEDRGDSFGVHDSPRDHHAGCVHTFGKDITEDFCNRNSIALVIRSHQAIRKGAGYEVMHGGMLVTVFSARDYEGNKNDGAVLSVETYQDPDDVVATLVVRPQQIWSHLKKKHISFSLEG